MTSSNINDTLEGTNVLIFGGTGFIGSNLSSTLKKNKVSYSSIGSSSLDLTASTSIESAKKYLDHEKTILVLASSIVREIGDNPESFKKNIEIALNTGSILERYNSKIKQLLYLSTSDVYGNNENLITENTLLNPETYYSVSKLASEFILSNICKNLDIPLLILRYPGVYGPNQRNAKYGPNAFIDSSLNEKIIYLWGEGEEKRNFLYVEDLTQVILSLMEKNIQGIVNIAPGISNSFRDMALLVKNIISQDIQIKERPRTKPSFNQSFNITKIKTLLPDFEFHDDEKALTKTYNWAKEIND